MVKKIVNVEGCKIVNYDTETGYIELEDVYSRLTFYCPGEALGIDCQPRRFKDREMVRETSNGLVKYSLTFSKSEKKFYFTKVNMETGEVLAAKERVPGYIAGLNNMIKTNAILKLSRYNLERGEVLSVMNGTVFIQTERGYVICVPEDLTEDEDD